MIYILIIYIYAAALSKSDSVAITNISGFHTREECAAAGKQALKDLIPMAGFKDGKFSCIQQVTP